MRTLFLLWALSPLLAWGQTADARHIVVDADAADGTPYTYRTFQEAADHLDDSCTVYIRPGVYWIDDPDDPAVRTGRDGQPPFGMVVRCRYLRLVGMGDRPDDVVLASQRGQTQGAVGNFTMFDFYTDSLTVENLTMGNYCNVDLVYPRNPRWNRPKRAAAITQAHIGNVHGRYLSARRVRFISRLNLTPLSGARRSVYDDCHFECTDDALNGTALYRHCRFDLYGQKPFWSTFGAGAMFIDCDFYVKSDNREMYFTKQGGPVTVVDCRYHASSDSIYIGWTAYPQPWLRCYQRGFTLNGKPYVVGHRQRQNTLQPSALSADLQQPPYLQLSRREATLQTGADSLRLTLVASQPLSAAASPSPVAAETVAWRVERGFEQYVTLRDISPTAVTVVPTNNTDEIADFCIIAVTADGREAACRLVVKPSPLPPPAFLRQPVLRQQGDSLCLDYALDLQGRRDESLVTWYLDDIPVSTSHTAPQRTYKVSCGRQFSAVIAPKHQRSPYGTPVRASLTLSAPLAPLSVLDTDFHDFYCDWQPRRAAGVWTVDGYKPADTAEFPWSFDRTKSMWEYAEGFNGAVGMGLLQAQRGARIMYTPVNRKYTDMSLTLYVDPTKTAGQGFGSATGQYMDVCLKFDTETLTGYGLRIVRTTKHAKAVDFLLVRYDHGNVTPLTAPVSSTCYRTGCTIFLDFIGKKLRTHVETTTPRPAGSDLPHVVDLAADVSPNSFGGIHIQHTGSCGESTTMLHRLKAVWR